MCEENVSSRKLSCLGKDRQKRATSSDLTGRPLLAIKINWTILSFQWYTRHSAATNVGGAIIVHNYMKTFEISCILHYLLRYEVKKFIYLI